MRQIRIAIVCALLIGGLFGVYWIATGQEGRPWPPPPIKYEDGSQDRKSFVPPVPTSGTMPPVPGDAPGSAPNRKGSVSGQWTINVLPLNETPKRSSAMQRDDSGIKQVSFQDDGGPVPAPPVVTMPPTDAKAANPSQAPRIAVPQQLDPARMPLQPLAGGAPQAMPTADPPRLPSNQAAASDPVQQTLSAKSKPPAFTRYNARKAAVPLSTLPATQEMTGSQLLTQSQIDQLQSKQPPQPSAPPSQPSPQPPPAPVQSLQAPPPAPSQTPSPTPPVPAGPSLPPTLPVGQLPVGQPPGVAAQPPMQRGAGAPPVQQAVSRAVSGGEGPMLLGLQTPPVVVEKRPLNVARPGEPQSFQLVVRNQGTIPAVHVYVEDDLPAGSRLLQAEPLPSVQANHAGWTLSNLPPGGTRVLLMTLQTAGPIEMHSTRVQVAAANQVGTPAPPQAALAPPVAALALQVGAPASVTVGQNAMFDVTYMNTSKQRVTGLVLHVVLSNGLRHPVGQSIEADVGDMEPGASKTVKVNAVAVQPGRQGVQAQVKSAGGAEATGQAGVDVTPAPTATSTSTSMSPPPPSWPSEESRPATAAPNQAPATPLTIQQAPARLFAGRTADLRLEVVNNTNRPLRNVCIASYLPEGVDFVAASDYGNYQPNQRTVNWRLDPLPPGRTQVVLLRVLPTGLGSVPHNLIARADGVPESRTTATLAVEGLADLAVNVAGGPSVEVGGDTVYEVRLGNPGSAPDTNVRVEVAFQPGLVPQQAKGPTAYRIDGQTVVFDNLSLLAAQGQVVFQIQARGQTPGDARVRASAMSDQVRAPVTRETMTRVYRD